MREFKWQPYAFGRTEEFLSGPLTFLLGINGDQNTSIQVEPNKPVDLSFKDGDTITFQFAGNGDTDKLTLDHK